MTALLIASHAMTLLVGLVVGAWAKANARYAAGVSAGQHQAEATHTGWHPILSEGWNSAEPKRRRRSPNRQIVPEQLEHLERPVMHRHP